MRRFIDLETQFLVSQAGVRDPISLMSFKRGDSARIEIQFVRGAVAQELPEGATGKLGIKAEGAFDGEFVVYAGSWVKEGAEAATIYVFEPSFNTVPLNTLLGHDDDEGENDIEFVDLMAEIQWTVGTAVFSTQTVVARVFNDVIKDDEGAPTEAPGTEEYLDERVVRHDKVQDLTGPQQAQARDNIGLDEILALLAPLASPPFTGVPTAPTAAPGTNNFQVANTAFVQALVNSLINGAPGAMDQLNELAAAMGNDPDFSTNIFNALALKAPLASPPFSGVPTAPTAAPGTSSLQLANTAFVAALGALKVDKVAGKGLSAKDYTAAAEAKVAHLLRWTPFGESPFSTVSGLHAPNMDGGEPWPLIHFYSEAGFNLLNFRDPLSGDPVTIQMTAAWIAAFVAALNVPQLDGDGFLTVAGLIARAVETADIFTDVPAPGELVSLPDKSCIAIGGIDTPVTELEWMGVAEYELDSNFLVGEFEAGLLPFRASSLILRVTGDLVYPLDPVVLDFPQHRGDIVLSVETAQTDAVRVYAPGGFYNSAGASLGTFASLNSGDFIHYRKVTATTASIIAHKGVTFS